MQFIIPRSQLKAALKRTPITQDRFVVISVATPEPLRITPLSQVLTQEERETGACGKPV